MKTMIVRGSWEAMGATLGRAYASLIRRRVSRVRFPSRLKRLVEAQTSFLSSASPDYLAMVRGLAEGSKQPFVTMLAIACWEYLFFKDHCSTILGRDAAGLWIAHNEDADPAWKGMLHHVRFMPTRGVAFSSFVYAGTPPGMAVGMNARGFAVAMNDMHRKTLPALVGEPPGSVGFRLLQSRSWAHVDRVYRSCHPNAGMHFLVADRTRARSLELYWDRKASAWVRPGFIHTNHPLLAKAIPGSSASRSSRKRLAHLQTFSPATSVDAIRCLQKPVSNGGARMGRGHNSLTLATILLRP